MHPFGVAAGRRKEGWQSQTVLALAVSGSAVPGTIHVHHFPDTLCVPRANVGGDTEALIRQVLVKVQGQGQAAAERLRAAMR